MSYDLMVFRFAGRRPPTPAEMQPDDVVPLGAAQEVRSRVSSTFMGTDWSDPAWGRFHGDGFSIEFNVGEGDPVDALMLHLRGGGDAVGTVAEFAAKFGWDVIDCQTDEFLDLTAPSEEGWDQWQAFRDKVRDRGRSDDN